MENNRLISFLRDSETRFIVSRIALLNNDTRKIDYLSDFDIYNILCENLYLLSGHKKRAEFVEILGSFVDGDIGKSDILSHRSRMLLWQRIFDIEPNEKKFNDADNEKTVKSIRLSEPSFNLNMSINKSFTDVYALLDATLEKIHLSNANTIVFDAKNLTYSRPNDYTATMNYEAFKANNVDISILLLWLLCRVFMNYDASLVLKVESLEKAEKILSMIFNLKLSPNLIISFDDLQSQYYRGAFELILKYKEKNISLEFFSKEIGDLKHILNEVPLCFISNINTSLDELEAVFSSFDECEKRNAINFVYKAVR